MLYLSEGFALQLTLLNPKSNPPGLRSRWIAASVLLHASLLMFLLYDRAPKLAPVSLPGDREGHHMLLSYSPHGGSPPSVLQSQKPSALPTPPRLLAKATPTPTPPLAPEPSSSASSASSVGADALGDGNMTIAFVVLHPSPRPDLGQLPSGTRGDVVVDVVIDKNGHVTKSSLERGLGHGVDDTVLATIQQWTFQPATRNGLPIASEQELLFHYERG
jgi:protein TonB